MGFFQIALFYVIVISLGTMEVGLSLAYFSPAYTSITRDFTFKSHDESIFNSLTPICAIAGCLAVFFFSATLTRKMLVLIGCVINLVGWIVLVCAPKGKLWMLFLSRCLQGIGIGTTSTISPVYIAEMSPTEHRGSYGVMSQFFVSIGAMVSYFLGIWLEWRTIAGISMIPGCLCLLMIVFVPNSPAENEKGQCSVASSLELFRCEHMKNLMISILLVIFQQFSGINALLTNLNQIFLQSNVDLDPSISAFIVGAAQVITTGISTPLVEKLGRKMMWIISAGGQTIFLLLAWSNETWEYSNILPIICLFFDVLVFGLGLGPLPWFVVPELFSLENVRSTAVSVVQAINWVLVSIMVFAFNPMSDSMGIGWVYFFYGIVMILATFYGLFLLPETRGVEMGEVAVA